MVGLGSTVEQGQGRQMRILTNHDTLIYRPYFHVVNAEFSSNFIRSDPGPLDARPPKPGVVGRRDPGNSRYGPISHLDSPRAANALRSRPSPPHRPQHLL